MQRFGQSLVAPSPHLYVGAGVRSLLCSAPVTLLLCCLDPFFGGTYFLTHNGLYMLFMEIEVSSDVALCSKFKALCGE